MSNKDIEQQAAYYLTCKNDGFSLKQKESFDLWINENIEHERIFNNLKNMQNLYSSISKDIKEQISNSVHQEIKRESVFRKYSKLAVAATILLCLSIGVFQTNKYFNFEIERSYITNNKIQNISLPDGSTIILDAKTLISVKYYEKQRVINLKEGKAFFTVSRDVNRPFIVNTNNIKIKVLGTSFEVNNQNDKLDVEVIHGVVSVQKYNNTFTKELTKLTKGKKISIDKISNDFFLSKVDTKTIASWKNGILTFQDNTLKYAINEFKKYKNISIVLQSNIEDLTITGVFPINDFDKFIYAISQIHSLESTKNSEKIYIFKKI